MPFNADGSYTAPAVGAPAGQFKPSQAWLDSLTAMNAGKTLYGAPVRQNALAPPAPAPAAPAAAPTQPAVQPFTLISEQINRGDLGLGNGFSLAPTQGMGEYGVGAGWMVLDAKGQPWGTYNINTPLQQIYAELPQTNPQNTQYAPQPVQPRSAESVLRALGWI